MNYLCLARSSSYPHHLRVENVPCIAQSPAKCRKLAVDHAHSKSSHWSKVPWQTSMQAVKKVNGYHRSQNSQSEIREHSNVNPVALWNLHRPECSKNATVLDHGENRYDCAQQNESNACPKCAVSLQNLPFFWHQHMHKQTKTFDDKTESHQRKTG